VNLFSSNLKSAQSRSITVARSADKRKIYRNRLDAGDKAWRSSGAEHNLCARQESNRQLLVQLLLATTLDVTAFFPPPA
jgi:hypothetical protein